MTGFALAQSQGDVRTVVFAGANGESLDTAMMGAVTDNMSGFVEAFENGIGVAQEYYNRGRLDRFIVGHLKMQEEFKASRRTCS